MAETEVRASGAEAEATALPGPSMADPRRPYEAPRIMKKRSLDRSTLFTAMTTSAIGLTMMG